MFPVRASDRGKTGRPVFGPRALPTSAPNRPRVPKPPVQGQLDAQRYPKPPVQGQLDVQRYRKPPVQGQLDVQRCAKPSFQGQLDVQRCAKPLLQGQLDVQMCLNSARATQRAKTPANATERQCNQMINADGYRREHSGHL